MMKRRLKIIFGILIFCVMLSLIGFKVNAAENSDYYDVDNDTLQEYAFNDIHFSKSRAYGNRFFDMFGVEYVERNVFTPNSSSVVVYEAVEEASSYYLNIWNNSINYEDYPTVSKLNNATALYNCHSYAWYLMNSSNLYWMEEPDLYYEDSSYYEVTNPRKGDKICYYDNTGYNLHSGIVIDTLPGESNDVCGDSNLVTVISKWGRLGLFEHRGDDCIYTEIHGGDAAYVKYYRPRTNNTYIFDNYSETINNNVLLISSTQIIDSYQMYEIDVNYTRDYEFIINSNSALDVRLYDEHMQLVDVLDMNNSLNGVNIVEQLHKNEIYYLRVAFADNNSSGTVSVIINFKRYLMIGNNNILSGYMHNIEDYVFTNNNSAGFYKITLNATNSSGTIDYPEGCIKVYADEAKQQMLARLETIFYTLDAETQGDSNNVIVFLEYGESYYINIDLLNESYSSMYINVERLTNTYDIIESNTAEEHVILDENTTAYGDYIQRVEIHEAGTYTITFTHEGPQSEENLSGQEDPLYLYYAFYKEVYSPAEQFGDLEMIFPHIASSWGGTISFSFNLQPGVYYIGYYNKLNNEPMSISITS